MAAAQLSATLVTARLAPAAAPPRTEPYKNPRNPNHLHLQPLSTSSSSSASSGALQCPHFQSCSGCTHEWDLDRPQLLQEVSKFFKDRGVADFSFDIGRLWEWRCRAKLAIRGTPESPLVGLYQEGTHSVVDIPQCRAHHPCINAAVDLLKQGISKLSIQPFDEDLGTGELRYVQAGSHTHLMFRLTVDTWLMGTPSIYCGSHLWFLPPSVWLPIHLRALYCRILSHLATTPPGPTWGRWESLLLYCNRCPLLGCLRVLSPASPTARLL